MHQRATARDETRRRIVDAAIEVRSVRGGSRTLTAVAARAGVSRLTVYRHFPDEVATNILTIEANDPKSGTSEFKATAIRIDRLKPAAESAAEARGA